MQFEDFDNKIKEAAENHHPAYDEKAWMKMEKLLDKHLPQKEDNRKRFIFFLLFLAGLGLAGLLILKTRNTAKPVAHTSQPAVQEPVTLPSGVQPG